jgi:hypothetical protein
MTSPTFWAQINHGFQFASYSWIHISEKKCNIPLFHWNSSKLLSLFLSYFIRRTEGFLHFRFEPYANSHVMTIAIVFHYFSNFLELSTCPWFSLRFLNISQTSVHRILPPNARFPSPFIVSQPGWQRTQSPPAEHIPEGKWILGVPSCNDWISWSRWRSPRFSMSRNDEIHSIQTIL